MVNNGCRVITDSYSTRTVTQLSPQEVWTALKTEGISTQGVTTQGVTTQAVTTQSLTTQGISTQGVTTQGVTTQGMTTQGYTTASSTECLDGWRKMPESTGYVKNVALK